MVELLLDVEDYMDEVGDIFAPMARDICEEALKLEGFEKKTEISLSLVSNHEIQVINKRYRKKDQKTDVLSFPLNTRADLEKLYDHGNEELIILGDIIISFDQAKEQAGEYNHSLNRELLYLVCHSVLHMLGYDHMTLEDRQIMREKEERVLEKLGITREI